MDYICFLYVRNCFVVYYFENCLKNFMSIYPFIYHLSICNYLLKLGKEYKQEIDRKGSGRDQ